MTDGLSTTPYVSAPARSREQAAIECAVRAMTDARDMLDGALDMYAHSRRLAIVKAKAARDRLRDALANIETLRQPPRPSDEPHRDAVPLREATEEELQAQRLSWARGQQAMGGDRDEALYRATLDRAAVPGDGR